MAELRIDPQLEQRFESLTMIADDAGPIKMS